MNTSYWFMLASWGKPYGSLVSFVVFMLLVDLIPLSPQD